MGGDYDSTISSRVDLVTIVINRVCACDLRDEDTPELALGFRPASRESGFASPTRQKRR
jgi:hypothetical protein